jgi:predicted RNase H-like HicB family nuclease
LIRTSQPLRTETESEAELESTRDAPNVHFAGANAAAQGYPSALRGLDLRHPLLRPAFIGASLDDERGRCQKLPGADLGRDATVDFVIFSIELDREDDGRWLAEVPALAGVMCYGADRDEAVARVQALALRVIAERLEHREAPAEFLNVTFRAA